MKRHGFSIGMERSDIGTDGRLYITMRACGTLSHQDYERMTPLLEAALVGVDEQSVDVFLDLTEFDGWELRAAWDDLKLGLAHGRDFRKIALFGNAGWQSLTAAVANWFVSGKVKFFTERTAALAWLHE